MARITKTTTWYFNCWSDEPRKRISPARLPESTADTASRTTEKLASPQPRNPRPPARSGWVGVSSRSRRETRNRNAAQSRKTQIHRRSRKKRIGRLTRMYHQPAAVIVVPIRSQVESWIASLRTTRDRTDKPRAIDHEHDLHHDRAAQADHRLPGAIERRPVRLGHQPRLEEMPHLHPEAPLDDDLGELQQGHDEEEPAVNRRVVEQRDRGLASLEQR